MLDSISASDVSGWSFGGDDDDDDGHDLDA